MKQILSILFLPLVFWINPATAQKVSIKKIWVNRKLEIKITADRVTIQDFRNNRQTFEYKVSSDKLMLQDKFSSKDSAGNFAYHQYRIIKLTRDTLILKPLTEKPRIWANGQDTLLLVSSQSLSYRHFKFEKLSFATTVCYGSCQTMQLEIDSTGKVFFMGKKYTGNYTGLYQGQLKTKDLQKLKFLLQHAWLNYEPEYCAPIIVVSFDSPAYNLILNYNGNRTTLFCFNAPHNQDISDFLLNCYKTAALKKYEGGHDFEAKF